MPGAWSVHTPNDVVVSWPTMLLRGLFKASAARFNLYERAFSCREESSKARSCVKCCLYFAGSSGTVGSSLAIGGAGGGSLKIDDAS